MSARARAAGLARPALDSRLGAVARRLLPIALWLAALPADAAKSPTQFWLSQASLAPSLIRPSAAHPWTRLSLSSWDPGRREGGPSASAIIAEASHWLGRGNPTGFQGPWCKAFTNFVLRRLGFHPGPSLLAIDALRDGRRVADPRPGDIAVMPHHVTFFAGWAEQDFLGLGGNQGHDVNVSRFPLRRVIAFIEPQ